MQQIKSSNGFINKEVMVQIQLIYVDVSQTLPHPGTVHLCTPNEFTFTNRSPAFPPSK